jgi:methylmalonyl-CoA mutase cobalamin-binding domain/chain
MAEDELDLKALADDELVGQMHDDLYDGLKEEIEEGVRILLDRGWTPYKVLTEALVEGMRIVGIDFRDGILFVPEVLMSANAMKAGMAILRPLLAATGAPKMGKMVIGTVKGDIHDIGKNLVCMMMEGAGFEVFDLGVNNGVDKYLEAIEEHQPEIVGMSALLTTTMPYMKVIIDTLKEKGIRNDHIVLVGGAPLNESFAEAIGADAYCRDAAVAVETARALLARRQGTLEAREALALKLDHIDIACLPAQLHNHPKQIPEAMRAKIRANRESYDEILCLYGDCGTGGELDRVLAEERVSRIEGAHCYEFYAGGEAFASLAEEEPGTFYLTDFLVRHFDALVIRGLGLDRFPELRDDYFGNYRRVVHLAQFDDPDMDTKAKAAADRLGLAYERRFTGLDGIRTFLEGATQKKEASWPA